MPVLGPEGEKIAVNWLQKRQFAILETNFRCMLGEIDIIAEKDSTICFVEVKSRSLSALGYPQEAVNRTKQRRLIRTAQMYLFLHPQYQNQACRFDVIAISPHGIEWIPDAFQTS